MLYEQTGSEAEIALVGLGIGTVARDQGRRESASATFTRSLELARKLGDEWTAAVALQNFGNLACDHGESAEALRCYHEALAIFERLGDQKQLATTRARLGSVALLGNDRATAAGFFRQCLVLANSVGYQPGMADGLEGMASCAAHTQPLLAARLFAAAAALRERLGLPITLADQPRHTLATSAARQGADPADWAAAWAEGRQLTPAQAIAAALGQVSGATAKDSSDDAGGGPHPAR
jgi:tetratricopeptide (TPR) repeat protein